jgi:hypothetical protein
MEGDGVICLAVDILPTEFSREVRDSYKTNKAILVEVQFVAMR